MALSNVRIGEIAMLVLQIKLEQSDEVRLNPKEIKRDVINGSKKIGISPQEMAEFIKIILKSAYDRTLAELDAMKS